MPTIIPRAYYCPKCKKEIKKKICDCGTKAKPLPPYSVRFRWINEDGMEEHKRIKGSPIPWETQTAAQRGYEQWISEHKRNVQIETHTVDFLPLYEEYKTNLSATVKESSYVSMMQRFDGFVLPYFKNMKVTEIGAADILKFQARLNSLNLSTSYKSSIRSVLNHFFSYLKIHNIQNPVKLVKGFKKNREQKREIQFWTEQEFKIFIKSVDDKRFYAVFSFLYLTGCRKGEALALQWKDVDLENKNVKIKTTISKATDKTRTVNDGIKLDSQYRITTPKTENSYRTILLPLNLVGILKNLKENASETDFVFGNENKIMSFNTLQNAFKRYIKRSGVKDIRIHDLRHSHVSLLINKGSNQLATLYIIAARLGDTVDMILKTYGHLFPNNQTEIICKLNIDF